MCYSIYIWLICFITVGETYISKQLFQTSLNEEQVNSNDQIHTFTKYLNRGIGSSTEYSEEDKRQRLLKILQGRRFGDDVRTRSECDDPKRIYSCFDYPPTFLEQMKKMQGDISKLGSFPTSQILQLDLQSQNSDTTKNIEDKLSKLSAYVVEYNDPKWAKQFYVQDYRTSYGPVMDLNVVPVYRLGFTGRGVKIAVLDTGVDINHDDLKENNLEDLNFDYCKNQPGCPLMKQKQGDKEIELSHGTEVTGIICMVANNNKVGVGVAYNAKFAGVRLGCDSDEEQIKLYPPTATDEEERKKQIFDTNHHILAKALNHRLDEFDIYSNSWGSKEGPTMFFPIHPLIEEALHKGIKEGRQGKGAIYVFGVGNSKDNGDNCSYDYYTNHMAAISVASVENDGKFSSYSERCSAVFTTAYGGSSSLLKGRLVSTYKDNGDTHFFYGTSASVPLVSGIIALALEANKELTYRDVMHLVARSSEVAPLANNKNTWKKNGGGFWVSHDFGFGLLNAERLVTQAQQWRTVPPLETCIITVDVPKDTTLSILRHRLFTFTTQQCDTSNGFKGINYLEDVLIMPQINYPARGAVTIYLTSPRGTRSTMVDGRKQDISNEGFQGFKFKSVQHWGENPAGIWTIKVATSVMWRKLNSIWKEPNKIEKFVVTLHGTSEQPNPETRTYDTFRLPDGAGSF